jgi:hypothetical protein
MENRPTRCGCQRLGVECGNRGDAVGRSGRHRAAFRWIWAAFGFMILFAGWRWLRRGLWLAELHRKELLR